MVLGLGYIFAFNDPANAVYLIYGSVLLLDDAGETSQAAAFSTLIMVVVVGVPVFFQAVLRLLGIGDVSSIG